MNLKRARLKNTKNNLEDVISDIKVDCDNYDQTVQALKALAHELLWDDKNNKIIGNGSAYFGRRMDTSGENRISPNKKVTPDLVVKLHEKYGVIAEAKITFPSDQRYRKETIIPIQKYDDNLIGWDTSDETIKVHDVILLVHLFHGKKTKNDIATLLKSKEISFKKKFSIITFAVVEQEQTFLNLDLIDGTLSDKDKSSKLEGNVAIKLEHIAANPHFSHIQLYDDRPPLPLLMGCIHEALLSALDRDQYLDLNETNRVEIEVDTKRLRKILSKNCGPGDGNPRTPEIPKLVWVRDAMGQFVKMGWAKRIKHNHFIYTLKLRISYPGTGSPVRCHRCNVLPGPRHLRAVSFP